MIEKISQDVSDQFPTQHGAALNPIVQEDLAIGAPFAPVPKSFQLVPKQLALCQPLPQEQEVQSIIELRDKFRIGEYQVPYVADIARAFRLLKNARVYLEIGTFDWGNLAYVATLLADDAHLIGVDIIPHEHDNLLSATIRPSQSYSCIIGSSRAPSTVNAVRAALGGRKVDAVFIDGDHTAYGVIADYAFYEEFVADDGVILLHDSVWEGNATYKGSADALAEINRMDPVYLIDGENPVRHFIRPMLKMPLWGVVGVVFAREQAWRRG